MVRRAIGVHSHFLQPADAEGLQRVGQRDPHAGMVLVIVGSMDLDVPAVEKETMIGVETDGTNAKGRLVTVHHCTAGADRRNEPMECGRLERPEPRMRDVKRAGKFARAPRRERQRAHRTGGDHLAIGIQDALLDIEGRSFDAIVGDRRARTDIGRGLPHLGGYVRAPLRHVQRRGFGQPDMPVDARPLIEPPLLHRGVHPDGNDIVAAVIEIVGQFVTETGVSAGLAAEVEAVDPHDRIAKHPVELDADAPAEVRSRDGEGLAVPADGTFGKVAANSLESVAGAAF